jgi:hypothetical protein
VPLVTAAVCPQPPLIVPEVAGAAAAELDALRSACDAAVDRLRAARPDAVVVLGADSASGWLPADAVGTLRPYGLRLDLPLTPGGATTGPALGLPHTVGAWLLGRRPPGVPVRALAVAHRAGAAERARLAGELHRSPQRLALLVMGDGSACRGEKSPGYRDPRAEAYDRAVAAALAGVDTDALLALDPVLSDELRVAGRAAWQVLAAAVAASGGPWHGELIEHTAPYGVGYFVAVWERG